MKLTDLEPQFLKHERRDDGVHLVPVQALAEAQGIKFLCPLCFTKNNGPRGTHQVICWFEDKVPDDIQPGPGRWNPTGSGFANLSFVPGKKSHSVLLLGGCNWHGFITNGEAN